MRTNIKNKKIKVLRSALVHIDKQIKFVATVLSEIKRVNCKKEGQNGQNVEAEEVSNSLIK